MRRAKNTKQPAEKIHPLARISLFFYDHLRLTLFLWFTILVLGFVSYTHFLSREGFPSVQLPISVISGTYFVEDAEKVDKEVTKPIAEALTDLEGVTNVQTNASGNFFSVVTTFDETVPSSEDATQRVRQHLAAEVKLPKEVRKQFTAIEPIKYLNKYDILLSVYNSADLPLSQLEAEAQRYADELAKFRVVKTSKMESNFSLSVNPDSGKIESKQSGFARVTVDSGEGLRSYSAVTIGLIAAEGVDVTDFSDQVSEAIAGLQNKTGNKSGITITADFAPSIETQISSLEGNMLAGLIQVSIICLLLITWRVSVIISLIITSVMAAIFMVFWLTGTSLNTISLFGLILVLGLFVDDATVMAEAIEAERKSKKPPRTIIKEVIHRVAPASLAGSLSTMLVFVPLLFIGGILGDFIRILPIAIIAALASSYILSIMVLPFLARYILLNNTKPRRESFIARGEKRLSGFLAGLPLVIRTHRLRGIAIAVTMMSFSIILIIASGYFAQKLSFNIFPSSKDSNELQVEITFKPGASMSDAEKKAEEVNSIIIDTIPESLVGASFIGANQRSATMQLELVSYTERETTSLEYIEKLQNSLSTVAEAEIRVTQIDVGPPSDEFPFKAQVYSENTQAANQVAVELQAFLQERSIKRVTGEEAKIAEVRVTDDGSVQRSDARRFVEVQASFDAEDVSALVAATQKEVETNFKPTDGEAVTIEFDFGQESDNQDSFSSLGVVGLAVVGVIILLLVIQFRSLLQALLIFIAVPFSIFGIMAGLYYTNNAISFFVLVGFFGLMGIAVNNTIMLTEYANQERLRGATIAGGMSEAIRKRFRPLITTSITIIMGLVPLALTDPFWEPLAFTILFGLISSTLLVIVSFPYYYILLESVRKRSKRKLQQLIPSKNRKT